MPKNKSPRRSPRPGPPSKNWHPPSRRCSAKPPRRSPPQQQAADQLAAEAAIQAQNDPQASPAEGASELAAQSAQTRESIEDIGDALRNEANRQDLNTEEGREAARDADDALARLGRHGGFRRSLRTS